MSQLGMQMPGQRLRRTASMNVYTGLLFLATVALIAACAMVARAGALVGKDGSPIRLQEPGRISVKSVPAR